MTAATATEATTKPADAAPKKFTMAFIGAGGIAGTHLKALAEMDDVEVVALADLSEKAMARHAEAYGIAADRCYTDYEQMLKEVQPDSVNICAPNAVHAPASIAASKAGAHVIVEKPMAMNASEAKAMIAAANDAGKKLVIGFQYRYDPRTRFLKRCVDDGMFGEIKYARVQALRRRGIPNWGVFGRKELQGGGPLIDIGVHCMEMCHYVMGSPKPVAATGMTSTYLGNQDSSQIESNWKGWDYKTYTVEDLAIGSVRFDNGAVMHVEASFAAHIEKNIWDFQVMGTEGGGTWDSPQAFHDDHGHMLNTSPGWVGTQGFAGFFPMKLRNFVDHCTRGEDTMAPAEHGLAVQQILDAIYTSAENGGAEVAVD